MMWGYGRMMNDGFGLFGFLGLVFWIAVLVNLILLAVWLWKQIQKK